MIIKGINRTKKKEEAAPETPKGPSREDLLVEIRDLLLRNSFNNHRVDLFLN